MYLWSLLRIVHSGSRALLLVLTLFQTLLHHSLSPCDGAAWHWKGHTWDKHGWVLGLSQRLHTWDRFIAGAAPACSRYLLLFRDSFHCDFKSFSHLQEIETSTVAVGSRAVPGENWLSILMLDDVSFRKLCTWGLFLLAVQFVFSFHWNMSLFSSTCVVLVGWL